MTEEEWLTSRDPDVLLVVLQEQASARKLRLFCCGCVRRIWRRLADAAASCRAVEVAEDFAEGRVTQAELATAEKVANNEGAGNSTKKRNAQRAAAYCAGEAMDALSIARSVAWTAVYASRKSQKRERAAQAALLRDIFGNPFRPVALSPAWRSSDVVALAEGIYADKAFDRVPILADALQDAGCDHPDVLNHCRDTSLTHVRGCWVIDLLTGRQ